jgi:anti-sigma B factor antagonist
VVTVPDELFTPGERFAVKWSGQVAVVTATGDIDITNAEGLRDALLSALNAGAAGLIADLTSTTFLDSAGITALVRAARRATAADATLRLAVTAPPVLRVLSLVGLDRLIEVYPSLAEAMASLPGQAGRGLPAARPLLTQPPSARMDSSTQAPSGPDATDT